MSYLGTDLSPSEYYARNSGHYSNPHQGAIEFILKNNPNSLHGRILDVGCGPGLATKVLSGLGHTDFVGVDSSEVMVDRYRAETGFEARKACFWDEFPKADSAVAVHSLHLCEVSRLPAFMCRLVEAGVKTLLIVSPLKGVLGTIMFCGVLMKASMLFAASGPPKGKTIWAREFKLQL